MCIRKTRGTSIPWILEIPPKMIIERPFIVNSIWD